jgi:hypothetical protein
MQSLIRDAMPALLLNDTSLRGLLSNQPKVPSSRQLGGAPAQRFFGLITGLCYAFVSGISRSAPSEVGDSSDLGLPGTV